MEDSRRTPATGEPRAQARPQTRSEPAVDPVTAPQSLGTQTGHPPNPPATDPAQPASGREKASRDRVAGGFVQTRASRRQALRSGAARFLAGIARLLGITENANVCAF